MKRPAFRERLKDFLRLVIHLPLLARYRSEKQTFLRMRKAADHADRAEVPVLPAIRLMDYGAVHPVPMSVYEVSFASEIIQKIKPREVIDIGSNVHYLAVLSSFIPVTSVDIRDIHLHKENFRTLHGDGRTLPCADGSIEFMTTLCVMEHIGLGRYGDAIDPEGDRAFARELLRCLKPQGHLVVSVPIGLEAICFNAHRIYTKTRIQSIFSSCRLLEERYIGSNGIEPFKPGPLGTYQIGAFHFVKNG